MTRKTDDGTSSVAAPPSVPEAKRMAAIASPPSTTLPQNLRKYRYLWPLPGWVAPSRWRPLDGEQAWTRTLPESRDEIAHDSRWPAFFPAPICLVTTRHGTRFALEKVVGASIVNRFPYIVALSLCRQELSGRHHARARFMEMLERDGGAAVQFLPPGEALDRAMHAIASIPESETDRRIAGSGLSTREATTNGAAVFDAAYLVYEARLVNPSRDFEGAPIHLTHGVDVGSHRLYFLEITAIQLRQDIAEGRTQIRWRSLPAWEPHLRLQHPDHRMDLSQGQDRGYQKPYTPHYAFPSAQTIGFEADSVTDGMAVKHLPADPTEQLEVDNDRARWPCFFPASVGMITTWAERGVPNLMPCGSTTLISRDPLVITPCISYAAINDRYAPRATLETIRRTRRFGCGVPFINDAVLKAIKYAGNTSFNDDPWKVMHCGLEVVPDAWAPVLPALPIHFDCEVTGEIRLGTHIMFLGKARRVRIRADLTAANPIEWCPWPTLAPV